MQVIDTLGEKERAILDRVYKQAEDRLIIEILADKMPVLGEVLDNNRVLVQLLHDTYVMVILRNQLTLQVDENGKNAHGQTQEEALQEINHLFDAISKTVARLM